MPRCCVRRQRRGHDRRDERLHHGRRAKGSFGAAHGVFGTIYDIGDAGGPLVGGVLVQAWGYAPTFQLMATLAAVTAIAFMWLSRPADRDRMA